MWAALRAEAALGAAAAGPLAPLPGMNARGCSTSPRFFAAERAHAERLPVEVLLERALEATGYDLAVLARAGGERRLANLRKLMRLAREYERAEGRDLRGFLAYAATRDLAAAREGEAPLESEGLDAVRLMTIHRAKGLEFPVVCVADLGRQGGGRHGAAAARRRRLGRPAARRRPAAAAPLPALAYERLARRGPEGEDAEERRLFYVAMTRACDRLILSGTADPEKQAAPRPGGPPLDWIAPALLGGRGRAGEARAGRAPGRSTAARPASSPASSRRSRSPPTRSPPRPLGQPRHRAARQAEGRSPRPPPAGPRRSGLSYTALGQYAKCPYRFYLQRSLRLPSVDAAVRRPMPPAADAPALDARVRGVIAHRLLEDLDFARPAPPAPDAVRAIAAESGAELSDEQVEDIRAIVAAFGASPLCARIAAARHASAARRRSRSRSTLRGGALVTGVVDVLARAADGERARRRLQERPARRRRARRGRRARLRHPADRLRARRPARRRARASRSPTRSSSAPTRPVSATFTARDVPALAERLTNLAEGVLEGRHPVAAEPHRALCGDCPGRATLCSWPEAMTPARARAGPQTSAGTFSGSGGPS